MLFAAASRHRKLFEAVPRSGSSGQGSISKDLVGVQPLYGITYSWRRAENCNGVKQTCVCPHPDDLENDLELLHR